MTPLHPQHYDGSHSSRLGRHRLVLLVTLSIPFLLLAIWLFSGHSRRQDRAALDAFPTELQQEVISKQIVGSWSLRNRDGGYIYYVTFGEGGDLTQEFRSLDSVSVLRSLKGAWELRSDTLHIYDRNQVYSTTVMSIDDHTMQILRSDSIVQFFDRMVPSAQ